MKTKKNVFFSPKADMSQAHFMIFNRAFLYFFPHLLRSHQLPYCIYSTLHGCFVRGNAHEEMCTNIQIQAKICKNVHYCNRWEWSATKNHIPTLKFSSYLWHIMHFRYWINGFIWCRVRRECAYVSTCSANRFIVFSALFHYVVFLQRCGSKLKEQCKIHLSYK